MNRRRILVGLLAAGAGACARAGGESDKKAKAMTNPDPKTIPDYDKWQLSEKEWKERLSPEAFKVLRKEATERRGASPLYNEHRAGIYACAGCGYDLFSSEAKYASGTGWPSFFDALPNALAFKNDYKLIIPRKEYHCARCGGHQGHLFDDGPAPTGLRYCNNGVALTFKPT